MAESPVFAAASPHSPHKLYSILEAANELPSVMESFMRRLEREETEKAYLFGNSLDMDDAQALVDFGLANMIRLQIIEFLLRNAAKAGYNLAHFLLGFSTDLLTGPVTKITSSSENFTCFHLILEILAYCLGQPGPPAVILEHPSFGTRCYELLTVLMQNSKTGKAVVNHLRDQEDFFRKQLAFAGREPVSLPEVGYTVYEMQAKAALIRGTMLDLHLAVTEGAWGYAKKLATLLVRGTLGDSKTDGTLDAGQSLVAIMMSSVEPVLTLEYLSPNIPEIKEQLVFSAGLLVRSCSKISQLMLATLDRVPYDRQAMVTLQSHLVTSIVPVIGRLMQNQSANNVILEQCSSLSAALAGGFFRKIDPKEQSSLLTGDELSLLAAAAIAGIVRNDSGLSSRGYLYSTCCDSMDILKGAEVDALKGLIRKDMPRLLEAAAVDSVVPSTEADGWKTMATVFLRTIIAALGEAAPLERLIRAGFLKNLIASLRNDDRSMLMILDPACQTLNSLYLWRARFSLLQSIACEPSGGERLVETGLVDVLTALRIFEWHSPNTTEGQTAPGLAEQRWHLIMLPLVHLLLLLATSPISAVRTSTRSLVKSHFAMFERILRIKNRLPTNEEHLEIISKVAQLLGQLGDPAYLPLFARVLIRVLNSAPECEWNTHISAMINAGISLFASVMIKDSKLVPVAFIEEYVDAAANEGVLSINILVRCLDGALATLARGPSDRLLSVLEGVLLILSLAIDRHAPKDSAQKERDIRQLSANAALSLEQLHHTISKDSGFARDQLALVERLLRDLRTFLVRPTPNDVFN